MASPRLKLKFNDKISSNTLDKAQAAKQYIERKYSKLKENEEERRRGCLEHKKTE